MRQFLCCNPHGFVYRNFSNQKKNLLANLACIGIYSDLFLRILLQRAKFFVANDCRFCKLSRKMHRSNQISYIQTRPKREND